MNKAEILKDVIFSRKSITPPFYDTSRKIPDEIIWEILDCANMAPNHKRTEPWRFTVFSGKGLQKFADMQKEIYSQYAGDKFSPVTLKKLTDFPLMCSHIIVVTMKRNEEGKLPEIEEIEACACAMQNIFLMATAHGIASYISTGGTTYFPETKPYYDLAADDKVLGIIHLGYPKADVNKATTRGNIKEKVRWIS